MPSGKFKSRTFRRIHITTPGGTKKIHYKKRKNAVAKCAACKKELSGVPPGIPSKIKKLPRSSRKPERPYGGYLCSRCTRKIMVEKARAGQ